MSGRFRAPFALVTGGKGGVGKTTIAANLGVELAREGRRVLAVDLDLGLADLDVVLGVTPDARIDDALEGRAPIRRCVARGPSGLDVLPAASGSESLASLGEERRERLLDLVAELSEDYDLVLGDSAAGVGTDVLAFAAAADRVLVVTTPDLAAITDAYGLIKALDRYGSRAGIDLPTPEVLVNHASGIEEAQALGTKLRSICERFLARSPRQAGWLPRSPAIERGGSLQTPFALRPRRALENVCIRQVATRLERLVQSRLAPLA